MSNTVKPQTDFIQHPKFTQLWKDSGFDSKRIVEAVQANKGQGELIEGSLKAPSAGAARYTDKGEAFKFGENLGSAQFKAKIDKPGQYLVFHDSICKVWKTCGQPSGDLTLDFIPQGLKDWLTLKFALDQAPAPANNPPPSNDGREVTPAVSGKRGKVPAVATPVA